MCANGLQNAKCKNQGVCRVAKRRGFVTCYEVSNTYQQHYIFSNPNASIEGANCH
ncbi:hypothetical protein SPONL_829 [uncultured Candidatus Thioglobus sp.]|nr:hypothetical protein SPONL_829 [uncultured Candidatus Thioglobus sp.]